MTTPEEDCLSPDEEVIREIGSQLEKAEALLQEMADEGCDIDLPGGNEPCLQDENLPKDKWCWPCRARAFLKESQQ